MEIRTSFEFSAAHRQLYHSGKCAYQHGHSWFVEVKIDGNVDKKTGYVIDFSEIKEIGKEFDHKTLLNKDDPLASLLLDQGQQPVVKMRGEPTAENLVTTILDKIESIIDKSQTKYIFVKVWEGNNNYAKDYRFFLGDR